jgi:uncharacterized protein
VPLSGLVARNLEAVVVRRLAEEPVVVLNGARSVGKSTLLRGCARARGVHVIDLDDPPTRQAIAADPTLAASGPPPVCIDEFQHVLPVLDAIKARLNQSLHPGQYLLTGSTRYAMLPAASQSLTGRAHVMTVWPLSQGELRGLRETFLDALMTDPAGLVGPVPSTTAREDYERMVLAGGFPLALARPTEEARRRWFRDFVDLVITRDALEIRRIRQRSALPRVLRRLAAQTAQVLNISSVARDVGMDQSVASDFVGLLEAVFLVHRLDGYGRTLSSIVRRSPKVHLVDSGLGAHLLGVTEGKLAARDPAALSEFGHLVETFAVDEILKQAAWSSLPLAFGHFRTKEDQEVDLVCEDDGGRVAAVEVKAASSPAEKDFSGLRLLRDKLGPAFLGGVVLHLGPRAYTREDRLHAVPLDRIWG